MVNSIFWKIYGCQEPMVRSSVWKMQMMRKMNSLIRTSQLNKNVRANCEKYFNALKELVELDMRFICCDEDEHVKNGNSSKDVLNPPRSRQQRVRNKRFESIVENKCDQVKQGKTKKLAIEILHRRYLMYIVNCDFLDFLNAIVAIDINLHINSIYRRK